VFAFGIAVFGNEHSLMTAYLLAIFVLTFCPATASNKHTAMHISAVSHA
jgi:hypothetical protein